MGGQKNVKIYTGVSTMANGQKIGKLQLLNINNNLVEMQLQKGPSNTSPAIIPIPR